MSLRNKQNTTYYDHLVTTSQPSTVRLLPETNLEAYKPGEWLRARSSFRIAVQNPKFEEVNVGRAALAIEWFQTVRTRVVKDCGVTLGYFPHDSFYHHENRVVVRKVEIELPKNTQKSSQ